MVVKKEREKTSQEAAVSPEKHSDASCGEEKWIESSVLVGGRILRTW